MTIIAAVDGTAQQRDALALAAALTAHDDGELIVAHVHSWPLPSRTGTAPQERHALGAAERVIAAASEQLGDTPHRAIVAGGKSVAHALHDLAEEECADVLVVGSSHRGTAGRVLFGTIGDRLLHGTPCAVAVAPRGLAAERPAAAVEHVGVAYDGGAESLAALAWAIGMAERAGADLSLLAVVEPLPAPAVLAPPPSADLSAALRREREEQLADAVRRVPPGLRARTRLLDGPAARMLADAAHDLDLLVCGSRAYGPVGAVLLGSVARGLFHSAPCPVVALPRTAVHDARAEDATGRNEVVEA
jgi:nucleotide-binding universal stress UspA family protein